MIYKDCQEFYKDGSPVVYKRLVKVSDGKYISVLDDTSKTGKKRPWRKHKINNLILSDIYKNLSCGCSDCSEDSIHYADYSEKLRHCGDRLHFAIFDDAVKPYIRLIGYESCKLRLCPLCGWRRSLKVQDHTIRIITEMQKEYNYKYIFMTLTVPNCSGSDLSSVLSSMFSGWQRLMQSKAFKNVVFGWYRGLEVTHNTQKYKVKWIPKKYRQPNKQKYIVLVDEEGKPLENPSFNTYHPHFHCVLAVKSNYFNSDGYITIEKLRDLWARSVRDDRINVGALDLRLIRPSDDIDKNNYGDALVKAIAEVSKYTVKPFDYIKKFDMSLSCQAVSVLDNSLKNRRLFAYGGVMKEYHKKLNLDDVMNGDLANISNDDELNANKIGEFSAFWSIGYNQYIVQDE